MNVILSQLFFVHLISFVFLGALGKFIDYRAFVRLVVEYDVLPKRMALFIGALIPFAEVGVVLLLLYSHTFVYGIVLLSILFLSIGYAVLSLMKSNRRLSCGCYGKLLDAEADLFTLGKIAYLLLVAIMLVWTWPDLDATSADFSYPLLAGLCLTMLLFMAQKVWSFYRRFMEQHSQLE